MPARRSLVFDDCVGFGDLPQRVALRPFCPPLGLPERVRRLRKRRGFFFSPSLEGGFELLELSNPRRRRSSAFSVGSTSTSSLSASISATASAEKSSRL